jgi:hypothetical protein
MIVQEVLEDWSKHAMSKAKKLKKDAGVVRGLIFSTET